MRRPVLLFTDNKKISLGISFLFNSEKVIYTTAQSVHRLVLGVVEFELVIIDKCHSAVEVKKLYDHLKEVFKTINPDCAFLFVAENEFEMPFKEFHILDI